MHICLSAHLYADNQSMQASGLALYLVCLLIYSIKRNATKYIHLLSFSCANVCVNYNFMMHQKAKKSS